MHIVICGGGQVGFYLAKMLARDHDVTIIDEDSHLVARAINNLDVRGVVGSSTYPGTLSAANVNTADLIIAVTGSDEVNILTCVIAGAIHNVSLKIARVRHRDYLKAQALLFDEGRRLPVDIVISPEYEVAQALDLACQYPGAAEVYRVCGGLLSVVRLTCSEHCSFVNTPVRHIDNPTMHLFVSVMLVTQEGRFVSPCPDDIIQEGDEIYAICASTYLEQFLSDFGIQRPFNKKVLIVGGGSIGSALAEILSCQPHTNVTVIENQAITATKLAGELPQVTVIRGNALDIEILKEASIESIDHVIAVTDDEKTNILSVLMAKNSGAKWSTALVNTFDTSDTVLPLGIDSVVMPRAITVSSILRHIHKRHVRAVFTLGEGDMQLLDIEVPAGSRLNGAVLESILEAEEGKILAVVRDQDLIMPSSNQNLQIGDRIVALAFEECQSKIDAIAEVI